MKIIKKSLELTTESARAGDLSLFNCVSVPAADEVDADVAGKGRSGSAVEGLLLPEGPGLPLPALLLLPLRLKYRIALCIF